MQLAYRKGGDRQNNGPATQWRLVWTLILAGVVAAFQIGKAPIAIPLLRQDLGLSLAFASWVVGIYAVVGGIAGLPAGLVINALGARCSLVTGLLVIGTASCAGAFAESGTILLLSRVFEGAGFLMVAIATPTLLGAITAEKNQQLVLGLWTVYFATGSVIVMLAGPPLGGARCRQIEDVGRARIRGAASHHTLARTGSARNLLWPLFRSIPCPHRPVAHPPRRAARPLHRASRHH